MFDVWGKTHFANYHAELRDIKRQCPPKRETASLRAVETEWNMVMDSDIREVLEGAKELRIASEQLVAKTQLLQAKATRLCALACFGVSVAKHRAVRLIPFGTEMTEENRWLVMEGAELLYESPICVTRLDHTVCPMPPFEERVQQLCKQALGCKTEAEAAELAQQLKALLHDHIEQRHREQRSVRRI